VRRPFRLIVLIFVLSSLLSATIPIPVTKSGVPRPADDWRIENFWLSPRGDLLALSLAGARHGTRLEFHALPSGTALWAMPFAAPAQVEWSRDGSTALVAGSVTQDGEEALYRIRPADRTVNQLADKGRIIAVGADGSRYAWRRQRGTEGGRAVWALLARTGDTKPVTALRIDEGLMPIAGSWSPDGGTLAYIGLDVSGAGQTPAHSAFLVRLAGRGKSQAVLLRTAAPVRPAWVNATTVRFVRAKPRAVLDFDTQTGGVTAVLDALRCPVLLDGAFRALAPDGTVLVTEVIAAAKPRVLRLLSLPSGRVIGEWPAEGIVFGRDGTNFALRSQSNVIEVHDRGAVVATLTATGAASR